MGILANSPSRRVLTLPAHFLVGRSAACFVRIPDLRVSTEHAGVRWSGSRWQLQDLGSRNGTWVNGRALAAGQVLELSVGDELAFGDRTLAWTVLEASGPVPTARDPASGEVRAARDGLLRLGEEDAPLPYLHAIGASSWVLEEATGPRLVQDGDLVSAGERAWVLHLAEAHKETVDSAHRTRWLKDVRWDFGVSSDEEYVEVGVVVGEEAMALGSRAHHYLLLTLARLRGEGGGWVYSDELARRLGLEETSLNVQIYRAREELSKLGVTDATSVVERRRGTGQLRTNITDFSERRI